MIDVCPISNSHESWYKYLVYYIQQGYLSENWSSKNRRKLWLKWAPYQIINGVLFKKNYDWVLLGCLEKEDASKTVKELHDRLAGGHYYGDITSHKILRAWYYYPTLFKYSHAYGIKYDVCQRMVENWQKRGDHYNLLLFHIRLNSWA